MATDLNSLKTRVKAALVDTGSVVWDDTTLTESIRLAVGEYGLAGKAAVTVSGLDGAAVTSLPALHDHVIVWGAGAYAALSRAVDRMEAAQLGSEASELKGWGEQRLKEFKAMLGSIFPGYLVVLSGSSSGGSGGADPAKTAAEIALMGAQADLAGAQAAAATGQETRDQAAADRAAADRTAEAARLAELHQATNPPWGNWPDKRDPHYPSDYERS